MDCMSIFHREDVLSGFGAMWVPSTIDHMISERFIPFGLLDSVIRSQERLGLVTTEIPAGALIEFQCRKPMLVSADRPRYMSVNSRDLYLAPRSLQAWEVAKDGGEKLLGAPTSERKFLENILKRFRQGETVELYRAIYREELLPNEAPLYAEEEWGFLREISMAKLKAGKDFDFRFHRFLFEKGWVPNLCFGAVVGALSGMLFGSMAFYDSSQLKLKQTMRSESIKGSVGGGAAAVCYRLMIENFSALPTFLVSAGVYFAAAKLADLLLYPSQTS